MIEIERPMSEFNGISIREARVDSKLPEGITLCFSLTPTPVPVEWKTIFTQISDDKHGSVMSITNPRIHGDVIIWQVIEGDIPNARHFVEERVDHTNNLFEQMLVDVAARHSIRLAETTSLREIKRLQRVLDQG